MEPQVKAASIAADIPYHTKKVLTMSEVSEYTGISKSYLYKLTCTNRIPHFKPLGKLVYFEREEIERWLMQNKVKTTDQIDQETTSHVTLGRRGGKK